MGKKYIVVFLLFLLLIVFSGCVSTQRNDGLVFTLSADPPRAFTSDNVRVIMDVENTDTKEYKDIVIDVFDKGVLEGGCDNFYYDALLPIGGNGQFKTYYCYFVTPSHIPEKEVTTTVYAKATYKTEFKAVQLIEMITEEYYDVHKGEIKAKPVSYVYRDKNVEVAIDFSTDLPIIVRPESRVFMKIQIMNVGNGFIKPITNLKIKPTNDEVVNIFENCDFPRLEQNGNVFPRQSCEIALPLGVDYLANYDALLEFSYEYEVRANTDVTIMRGY